MAPKSEKWKAPGKTRNLTEQQVKAGSRVVGGGRTERLKKGEGQAAVSTKLDINQTKWMTAKERGGKGRGGLLTDASGKALTGTVTLPSGARAAYVRGKRVTTAAGASRINAAAARRTGGPTGSPPSPPAKSVSGGIFGAVTTTNKPPGAPPKPPVTTPTGGANRKLTPESRRKQRMTPAYKNALAEIEATRKRNAEAKARKKNPKYGPGF